MSPQDKAALIRFSGMMLIALVLWLVIRASNKGRRP